jgi:hypothetical protein
MLTLPGVIKLVTPVAAFAATVYVTNRISNESELVIVQQAGFSPWRIARPVLVFGLLVAVFAGLLAHVLVPASLSRLADRQDDLAENVTARLLVEGRFLHPSDGVTFYIARISPEGELDDVFLSDGRQPGRWTSYTADRGLLVRNEASPRLIMLDGLLQRLDEETGRMSVTRYDQLTLDIASILGAPARSRTDVTERLHRRASRRHSRDARPHPGDAGRCALRGARADHAHASGGDGAASGLRDASARRVQPLRHLARVVGAVALLVLIQSAGLATSAAHPAGPTSGRSTTCRPCWARGRGGPSHVAGRAAGAPAAAGGSVPA